MKKLILHSIRLYQKYLSLDTGALRVLFPGGPRCRYTPRCSEYCYQAISKYGILKGSFLGMKRVLRCHPGFPGGFDPVP